MLGTELPIFTIVLPFITDVFAPPYTFPYIVAPTIFTVLVELFVVSPVAALFPPPNTLPVDGILPVALPIIVLPSIVIFVLPSNVAVSPLPPA